MERNETLMRRVLVLLDASRTGLATVETAAKMAARAKAQLTGLFVEDDALLRSAALPFAREVSLVSASLLPLDTVAVERRLRAEAAAIRIQLRSTAQRFALNWSLQVSRGELNAAAIEAAQPDDILIVNVGNSGGIQRGHRGAQVAALTAVANCPILVLTGPATQPSNREIVVLVDKTSVEDTAIPRTALMARVENRELLVLISPSDDPTRRVSALREWLEARGQSESSTVKTLSSDHISALVAAMRPTAGRMLAFRQGTMGLTGSRLAELIRTADFPVFIVP